MGLALELGLGCRGWDIGLPGGKVLPHLGYMHNGSDPSIWVTSILLLGEGADQGPTLTRTLTLSLIGPSLIRALALSVHPLRGSKIRVKLWLQT